MIAAVAGGRGGAGAAVSAALAAALGGDGLSRPGAALARAAGAIAQT
jgi:hypothetical protein